MICSRDGTGEGREQGKVSIKSEKKPSAGLYLLPLVTAVPMVAAMTAAVWHFWPQIQKLFNILIKLVVKA